MKKLDEDIYKRDMSNVNFDSMYDIKDSEVACSVFLSLIMPVIDKHAPLRRTRIKQKESPWMTADILKLIRHRDRLKQKTKTQKPKTIGITIKKLEIKQHPIFVRQNVILYLQILHLLYMM